MGMKEEIFSIATALGYDGPTSTSKTKAVHAVAEAVESGGGSGGAGYDVTKVWAVPEQTVTSHLYEGGGSSYYVADVTVGDLAQMYADGQRSVIATIDGETVAASIYLDDSSNPATYGISGTAFYVDPVEGGHALDCNHDTEPTTHTLGAYYADATTTADFDAAVVESVGKSGVAGSTECYLMEHRIAEGQTITVQAGLVVQPLIFTDKIATSWTKYESLTDFMSGKGTAVQSPDPTFVPRSFVPVALECEGLVLQSFNLARQDVGFKNISSEDYTLDSSDFRMAILYFG